MAADLPDPPPSHALAHSTAALHRFTGSYIDAHSRNSRRAHAIASRSIAGLLNQLYGLVNTPSFSSSPVGGCRRCWLLQKTSGQHDIAWCWAAHVLRVAHAAHNSHGHVCRGQCASARKRGCTMRREGNGALYKLCDALDTQRTRNPEPRVFNPQDTHCGFEPRAPLWVRVRAAGAHMLCVCVCVLQT